MAGLIEEGRWKQVKGELRERWGFLTDNDLERSKGHWERLVGMIQEKSGEKRDEVHRKVEEILSRKS